MPIRFRCAYCNQLMGISKRKAGTVVRCPKCAGEIIVPSPDAPAEEAPELPSPIAFEDPKFEQNFPANGSEAASESAPVATAPAPEVEESPAPAPIPVPAPTLPPPPAPLPAARGLGLFLPLPLLLVSVGVVILLLILVFVLGLIIGRHTAITSDARVISECHGILHGASFAMTSLHWKTTPEGP